MEVETWDGPFHKRPITKGEYGKVGKIVEEMEEALDAIEQNQTLMLLIECSDILGACVGVLTENTRTTEDEAYIQLFENSVADWSTPTLKLEKLYPRIKETHQVDLTLIDLYEIVSVARGLASTRGIEYDELQHYAQLRSRVARHAIKKVEEANASRN